MPEPPPRGFRTVEAFRAWLARHHATIRVLTARCFKKHARHRGIGHREILDEALCWGWIDGIARPLDADSYTVRFTPRQPKSRWSEVNVARFRELQAARRVQPPGLAAFQRWDGTAIPRPSTIRTRLAPDFLKRFRANRAAWSFFEAQPPGYRQLCARMVMEARRPETREKRFRFLLACSVAGRRLPGLAREKK